MVSGSILFAAPWDAERLFAPIVSLLPGSIEPVYSEMLATDPANLSGWSFDAEISALDAAVAAASADEPTLLVAYSGSAAVSLGALAETSNLVSAAVLLEPPWIGNDVWSDEEAAYRAAFSALPGAESKDAWKVICAALNAPGTPLPPPPAMPPELLKAGFVNIWNAYMRQELDRDSLAEMKAPVVLPVGELSAARMAAQASLLCELMPNARELTIPGAAHFDLPFTGARTIADEIVALIDATATV